MTVPQFTAKERMRFRKLLEVAQSTDYAGERDAALQAATRLAANYGMSLREAAGMSERHGADASEKPARAAKHHNRPAGFPADFGAATPETMGRWWSQRRTAEEQEKANQKLKSEVERYAAEKRRHEEAMAEAVRRGLDAEERLAEERKARRAETLRQRGGKRRSNNSWRPRPEFVRVLLKETHMSAKEIAAVAGVTIYDVFREKLLMRPKREATTSV